MPDWMWLYLSALGFLPLLPILKRRRREKRIRLGLADAVDLLVLCIEAGLSPDKSLVRVSKDLHSLHPDLSDELYLVSRKIRAGYSWDEALCSLSERTGVGDIKVLVDASVQVGPLAGVSVLRAYSYSLRNERQQRAEAQVDRSLYRLLFFLFFVVPSVLIVTLGPGLIQLIRTLR